MGRKHSSALLPQLREEGEGMSGLKSEILFNRAVLYMVMGGLVEGAMFKVVFFALMVWMVVKSALAYMEDE